MLEQLLGSDAVRGHGLGIWLFIRGLGAAYFMAFASLWTQVDGLLGHRGILPIRDYLSALARRYGGSEPLRVPTLFWLDSRDVTLHAACATGILASLLVLAGVAPAASLIVLWLLYLSFAAAGQVFLSYQWDVLLLEAGLVGLLLAPWELLPGTSVPPPDLALFLLWWLLFRLMFQSGLGKLTSGDESWKDLTALDFHWCTQPLPTPVAWYVEKFPRPVQRFATAATHVVEIGVPFLVFGPAEARWSAAALVAGFQLLIMATGNYNFFNLLTIALCFPLVADGAWASVLPARMLEILGGVGAPLPGTSGAAAGGAGPVRIGMTVFLATLWTVGGLTHLWRTLRPGGGLPRPLAGFIRWIQPFRTVNSYGLFRVMTRKRPEIIVEGSRDGEEWKRYEFSWKPGDLERAPPLVQPHQPRLDWQMWFAALGQYRTTPWFRQFQLRLLEGAGQVLELLDESPFPPDDPPEYVRARLYEYSFTDRKEKRETGRWWKRREVGSYGPVLRRGER